MANWVKTEPVGDKECVADVRTGEAYEVQTFRVYFDDVDANAYDALKADQGIPQVGDLLSADSGAYVSYRAVKQEKDDRRIFIVTVKWQTLQIQMQTQPPPGKQKWAIQVSGQLVPRQEEINSGLDSSGNPTVPIVNSAGEPFDRPLTFTYYDEQINVTFYTNYAWWIDIEGCIGHANSGVVTMTVGPTVRQFDIHTLLMIGSQWTLIYGSDGYPYVQFTLTFLHRPETWTIEREDMGFNQKGDDGKLYPILIPGTTEKKNLPSYLDGAGKPLADGANVVKIDFENISDVDFSPLFTDIG